MIAETALILMAVAAIFWFVVHKIKESKTLPPGPRPYPLVGNVPQLAGKLRHEAMTELAEEYGKIYTLHFPGGTRCIVVNSAELTREALLTKRDAFSGRPPTFIGSYMTRGGKDIICADFTQTMVYQRKIAHSALRMYGSGMQRLESSICGEVEQLCSRLRAHKGNPIDPKENIALTIMNVICLVVYGDRYEIDEPEFKKIVLYNDMMAHLFGSYNLIDLFPWLRFLPTEDASILRESVALRDSVLDVKYRKHKERFDRDMCNNNKFEIRDLTDALLKAYHDEQINDCKATQHLSKDHITMTMHDVFNAGLETTATALRWLMGYLVVYPEVQARLHTELDDVIGCGRLPRLADRVKLPYLESVIAEVLRLATIVPLSLPHKATRDTTLGGYDVPKGTMLITNTWAMHHDGNEWDRPYEFIPERFLGSDGKFQAAGVRSYLPFSAGRRVCLGESLAKTELFLVTSRLLHQFQLEKASNEPLPDLQGEAGVIYTPVPYKICIKERL